MGIVELSENYDALHKAEAAYADGNMMEARRFFRLAEIHAASREEKALCRWRRKATFPVLDNPKWSWRAFSNVRIDTGYYGDSVCIIAELVDLKSSLAELLRRAIGEFSLEYIPLGRFDDGEYDPELFHPELIVYGRTALEARGKLQEVSDFLIGLARSGKISEDDCKPCYRPGDSYVLRHMRTKHGS